MRTTKIILVISSVLFFVGSIVLYVFTFNCTIDDVVLNCIPLYLNPARTFFIAALLLFLFFIIISKSNKIYSIEKIFVCYVLFLLVTGICAGVTAWIGYSTGTGKWESTMDFQQASEESKQVLPFHDLFFEYDEHYGAYYVGEAKINGSTYICANNYVPYGMESFSYEAEFFKSKSIFLLIKFYINKLFDLESNYDEYVVDDIKFKKFINEDNYTFLTFEDNSVFYVSVFNANEYDVTEDAFFETALNQLKFLKTGDSTEED